MFGRTDSPCLPELTDSELRLLPLLATPISLSDAGQLLEMPRDEVLAHARSIYAKLGLIDAEGPASAGPLQ